MANSDIIAFIKNNLNNDFDHDFNYLMSELIHYQKLRGGEQIVQEIIKLFKSELGDAGLKKFNETIQASFKARIDKFNEAITCLKEQKRREAQDILVKLIDTFPVKKTEEDLIPIFNFQNVFESILFTRVVKPQNHIRQVNEPIAGYYFHLAIILFDEKDYEECLKMLEYVLSYNPVYIEAYLLKSECYLQLGYNNLFFDNIKEALLYSYTRVHFAKAYFLLGRYYLELGNKETALSFFVVSKHYDKTPFIDEFMRRANALPGEFKGFSNPAELLNNFNKLNIQFGPSKMIIELLNTCINDSKKNDNIKLLKYFLTLIFNITQDEKYKKELEGLK